MPIKKAKDSKGKYYQWGNHGKKYYTKQYGDARARKKAERQARAIYSSGYHS